MKSRVEKGRITLRVEVDTLDRAVVEDRDFVSAKVADRLLEVCEELRGRILSGEWTLTMREIEAVIEDAKRGSE